VSTFGDFSTKRVRITYSEKKLFWQTKIYGGGIPPPLRHDATPKYRVPTPPGKSWIFFLDFPGPGKSWKISLVLECPGN